MTTSKEIEAAEDLIDFFTRQGERANYPIPWERLIVYAAGASMYASRLHNNKAAEMFDIAEIKYKYMDERESKQ